MSIENSRRNDRLLWILGSILPVVLFVSLKQAGVVFRYFNVQTEDLTLEAALPYMIMAIPFGVWALRIRSVFAMHCVFSVFVVCLNFVWIATVTKFNYEIDRSIFFVLASLLAFTVACRFPMRLPQMALKPKTTGIIAVMLLCFLAVVVLAGSMYNFTLVGVLDIYEIRQTLEFPPLLQYAILISVYSVGPYLVAYFLEASRPVLLVATVLLYLLFFPITAAKAALGGMIVMLLMALAMHAMSARVTVVALMITMLVAGIVLQWHAGDEATSFFGIYNFRNVIIPASILDHYIEFFSSNAHTHFCTIGVVANLTDCAYDKQLSLVMQDTYGLGNLNASFLATEGVAALGVEWMPVVSFVCGLVLTLGVAASQNLPDRFVLISSAPAVSALINTPFSTFLVSCGFVVLVLLWSCTSRELRPPATDEPTDPVASTDGSETS